MKTLQERIAELRAATNWSVADIARHAKVTSSAVSQWAGHGKGKQSKTIGNIEAAHRLEKASGFSALWLARGVGPKLAQAEGEGTQPPPSPVDEPSEPPQNKVIADTSTLVNTIRLAAGAILTADEITRVQVAALLTHLADDPTKAQVIAQRIANLLENASGAEGTQGASPPWGGADLGKTGLEPNGRRDSTGLGKAKTE